MAQVSYGTITITDTNDIERIYMEYAQSSSNSTAPTTGWSENIPAWEQGKYIWQRTVVKKEGVALSSDSYGDPVCLTGSTGSTGSPGATGRGVSSIVTTYCNYGTGTPAASYSGWGTTVPTYDSTKPNYWIKTVITYTSGTPATDTKIYQDNGITSATATAASAKTQAAAAEDKADTAVSTANTANTNASNALNIANGVNQHFWWIANDTATTGGTIAAGAYITDIAQSTFKTNPSNYGNLLLRSDGVYLNLGLQTLASFKSNALTFYNSAGTELGKFGSTGLEMSGTLNIKGGGRIGQDSDNYWEFGDNRSYNDEDSAYLIGKGTASIQLGETGHWRLDKNRIHTGWYQLSDSSSSAPAGSLHFDTGADGNSTYYWDYGMHYPNKAGNGNNKFLYIRRSNDTTSTTLATMKGRIDNDDYWTYKFYIDGNGNVHAPGFYIGDSTTPIGGGAGTVAERLTQGYGSSTQPIYFNSNGVPTNTTYALNAAGAKGVDTSISAASTSTNLPTSQAVAAFVEGKGYITSYTDNKVQTSQANTTKIFLAGTSTAGTSTGTLNFDSNVYLTTTAGTLHATTFEGNLSGTATKANQDGDGNVIKSTYLKLSGGNVTGAVTFGSSVSVDELTAGDLVVNGNASFTNNLQANTINGVAVGSSPKFTDTVTTVTVTGSGNAVTSASVSNGAVTLTKGMTFLTSYTETDPIFIASAAHEITSSDISNWNSKTSNTGTVTSVRVQASSPLTSTTSTASSTTLDTTIKFSNQNKNLVLAGPSSGNAAAPAFRSLVADDIPIITKSKISDFPSSLKNPNALSINVYNATTETTSGYSTTAYDGNIANQSVNVAGNNAITKITSNASGQLVIQRASGATPETVTVKITATTSESAETADKLNLSADVGSTSQPVYFDANTGLPKAINYTIQSNVPQNAQFTDTTYSAGTGLSLSGTTFNHSNSITAGTAGTSSATSSTNRTISIPYVTYDAQGHITGSGTHTHTLDSFPEAYLAWGGKNITSDITPVGMSISMEHSANRIAYLNPAAIQIEYTTNGGTSWSDSGYTDIEKMWLCTSNQSIAIGQSKSGYSATTALTTNNWTRITLTGQNGTTQYVYTNPRKLLVNMLTALSVNCLIEYKTGVSGAEWQTFGTYAVAGWSGWNDIPLILSTFGGGTNQTTNYWYLRFTFKVASTRTDNYKGMANIYGLRLFGTNNWGSASSNNNKGPISSTGHLYDYDANANAIFPAQITATQFNGNATSATNASKVNNHTVNSDVPANAVFTDTWKALSTSQAGYVSQAPNSTSQFLRGDATWAAVTKANVGLGNVENTALSTWTGTNKITTLGTITTGTWNGSAVPVANGGTGATTAANARTNLGLGSAATASTTTSIASGGTGLPTAGTVYTYVTNAISGASNTYVTIATDQTITANQKTFNGAIRWGTASKYGAVNYDSTLEALVFSFI